MLDFGLARGVALGSDHLTIARIDDVPPVPGDESGYSVTRVGSVVGTVSHMSP